MKVREKNKAGEIVATLTDYKVVRRLILPHFAEAVEAAVPQRIVDVVRAVTELRKTNVTVNFTQLGAALGMHRSNAAGRAMEALAKGYITNVESHPSRPPTSCDGGPDAVGSDIATFREATEGGNQS